MFVNSIIRKTVLTTLKGINDVSTDLYLIRSVVTE